MTDYSWRPHGVKVQIQGVPYDPMHALRNFVLPIRHKLGWIENSKNITNTGLSAREWLGLVLHAITLTDMTGDNYEVATENTGGDGAIVRIINGEKYAVLVEQTLATHLEKGELVKLIETRVNTKSIYGQSYAGNKHLIVLCNNNGDIVESELASIVAKGAFNIVAIIGFQDNHKGRHFLCFVFDKDIPQKAVHKSAIIESNLWQQAIDIYNEQKNQ